MKKFIITSTGYIGEVHIVYDAEGLLMIMDFSHAALSAAQVHWFNERIPSIYFPETFAKHLNSSKLTIVEDSYEITVEMFMDKYKKKVNLKRVKACWAKMSKTKQVKAYHGITAYDNHLALNSWKSKADPETYLKKEYWETDWSKV